MLSAKKVSFNKIILETEFGPIETSLKTELIFRGNEFSDGLVLNNPELIWETIPKIEVSDETADGKYFLMLEIINCPVKFIGSGNQYEDRMIFMTSFMADSLNDLSPAFKILKEAAENKRVVIIKAKLFIEGFYRIANDDMKALINRGEIKIINIQFK